MERRSFLRASVLGGTAAFTGSLWQSAADGPVTQ
ncbi:twin-arginine translocation signal domain-containing protein [Actinomadura kijaniata]